MTDKRLVTVSLPPPVTAAEIVAIRRRLGVSQAVFAEMLNVHPATVRAWEQGARVPDGGNLRLLEIACRHPEMLSELVHISSDGGQAKS